MSGAEEDRKRAQRAGQVALFRYRLIREAADPGLTARQRGRLVREHRRHGARRAGRASRSGLAGDDRPVDPGLAARAGSTALVPSARQVRAADRPRSVLELAAALKRENPERTAAQVQRILAASRAGGAPSVRTLQRHFARRS